MDLLQQVAALLGIRFIRPPKAFERGPVLVHRSLIQAVLSGFRNFHIQSSRRRTNFLTA